MPIPAAQPPLPSPDSSLVASLAGNSLRVYDTRRACLSRTIPLKSDFAASLTLMRWNNRQRILLTNGETVHVYDLEQPKWKAKIDSIGGSLGKCSQLYFGADAEELLIFSVFGIKLNVWSLRTGKNYEIKDPKFPSARSYSYRPETGHFALLSRPAAYDILTIHAPGSYEVLATAILPTVDAQRIRWSPDGRWIALSDCASAGTNLFIYTADGQMYRAYKGGAIDDVAGLGIRTMEWSPNGKHLAIGGFDNRVILLNSIVVSSADRERMLRANRGSSSLLWPISTTHPPLTLPIYLSGKR